MIVHFIMFNLFNKLTYSMETEDFMLFRKNNLSNCDLSEYDRLEYDCYNNYLNLKFLIEHNNFDNLKELKDKVKSYLKLVINYCSFTIKCKNENLYQFKEINTFLKEMICAFENKNEKNKERVGRKRKLNEECLSVPCKKNNFE